MSQNSKIEWTDATWNPVRGCSRVSEGCRNCYAERIAARFCKLPAEYEGTFRPLGIFGGFSEMTKAGPRWTGKVALIESKLDEPLHWREPRRIFVNSMSDLFHEALPDEAILRVMKVMERAPQHTYQVLTKRAERMRDWVRKHLYGIMPRYLHLGVSAEDQPTADARIPLLRQTPAAVRFLSLEPLLGPIDVYRSAKGFTCAGTDDGREHPLRGIDQVIVGGESGPGARPMNPDWVRSIRDQCVAAGVPFFFKQWGEWTPTYHGKFTKIFRGYPKFEDVPANNGTGTHHRMFRVGKKAAGRVLDGRTWDEGPAPEVSHD